VLIHWKSFDHAWNKTATVTIASIVTVIVCKPVFSLERRITNEDNPLREARGMAGSLCTLWVAKHNYPAIAQADDVGVRFFALPSLRDVSSTKVGFPGIGVT
jgi:hypothetical protein